jgi:hypothetical protein
MSKEATPFLNPYGQMPPPRVSLLNPAGHIRVLVASVGSFVAPFVLVSVLLAISCPYGQ